MGCDGRRDQAERGPLAGRAPGMLLSPGDTQAGSHKGTDAGRQGRVPVEGTACTEAERQGEGRTGHLGAAGKPVVWSVCVEIGRASCRERV